MDDAIAYDPRFEVSLLGGFALRHSAGSLVVPTSLQRLVAYLALRGPAPRSTAAGVLWPSTSDDRAMASMRTAVWRLSRVAHGLLAPRSDVLALHVDVAVDVAAIDFSPVCSAQPELLPGWYDDWVIMERERFRHRHLRAMEAAAEAAIEEKQPHSALNLALAAAAADPLRESAHRLVIRALLADGNVGAARRHFDFVQDILREQLGIAPSAQLVALIGQMPAVRRDVGLKIF
jgi:DNA-binding SARP family transcriptional activator